MTSASADFASLALPPHVLANLTQLGKHLRTLHKAGGGLQLP